MYCLPGANISWPGSVSKDTNPLSAKTGFIKKRNRIEQIIREDTLNMTACILNQELAEVKFNIPPPRWE